MAPARFAAAEPATAPPAEAFGRLPAIRFAAVSPNGKFLVMEDGRTASRKVVVQQLDSGRILRTIDIDPENKLRALDWADDDTLLITVSFSNQLPCNWTQQCAWEWYRTLAVGMDGSPPRVLLMGGAHRKAVTGARLLATHAERPHTVIMETLDYSASNPEWVSTVFEVDTQTGKGRDIATGTPYTAGWVVDSRGRPIARAEWRATTREFVVEALREGRWREIYRKTGEDALSLGGLSSDGKSLVVTGAVAGGFSKAWSIPLDGSGIKPFYEDPQADVTDVYNDPYTNAVVGVTTGGAAPTEHWIDPVLAENQRTASKTFPNQRVSIHSYSQDRLRVIAVVDSHSKPRAFQFIDFDKSRASLVGEAYPELHGVSLGKVQVLKYLARDGTEIPAYLTLPPDHAAQNLPLVVLPHGGPAARDLDEFDWLAQFLATRGYAVLQPQFRGSTGFGTDFRHAGQRQWGRLMQDDITDGARKLLADGTVDPKRICIVGASYGGYAALAGVAFTPEVYACAASINGVTDLPDLVAGERLPRYEDDVEWKATMHDLIGSASDPELAARSPSRSADTIKAPVLLVHSSDDMVVPFAQSELMAKALASAGKSTKLVKIPGEDHWLSREDSRVTVLKQLESFLAQYLN
ncbi:MAG TPA: S9 family peptidase [Steroidobacteraceae bacterium]|nr:S9 family peptidase [Steroidobacteraceae bacterium]